MKKNRTFAVSLFVFLFLTKIPGIAQTWTFQTAVKEALRVNPRLHSLENQVKAPAAPECDQY